MLKAQTILCLTLAVVVGRVAAQEDADIDNLFAETETDPSESASESAVTEPPAVDGIAAYLPPLADIETGLQNVIKARKDNLHNTYVQLVNKVKVSKTSMDAIGASWQLKEQTNILNDFGVIKNAYQKVKAANPAKDFTKCDAVLNKIATFLTSIGSDFYSCHYYYNNITTHVAHRIFPSQKPESDLLKSLLATNCNAAAATDLASKTSALSCLIDTGIKFYNRPNADIGLTIVSELVEYLVVDQNRYLHSCPGYAKWHVYAHFKPQWVETLKQCITRTLHP